jgi:hypothetical protein
MINNSGNKSNTAFKLFGQRAKDAGIILANNIPRFEEFAGQLADGNKQLQAMVNIMEDNLHTDLIKLTSAWDGMIQKGGVLTPILRGIVQEFTNLIKFGTMTGMPGGAVIIAKGQADEIEAATKKYKEQQLALRRIENTVQAAFDSGNVEAYIKALDSTIGKEEIIAEIRRRQKALRDEELTIADQELQNLIARGDEWKKLYDFAQLTEEINKRMTESHIVFSPEEIKAVTDELTKYELSIEGLLEDYPMMTELTEEQTEALAESLRILKLLNEEKERQSELEKLNIRLAQIAIQGYIDMMHTVSQMRKSGEKDWKAYAKAIVNSIRKVIIALVAEYIAMQIGKAIEKSKTWYGALIQSGLAAAATATALDALIPSFAQGGAVFGPTLAMVGDNPGASHDPEIIAPLSQLSGGMGGITVNFYGPTNPREAAQEIEDLLNRHGFNKNR